ncbi:MAG: protein TolQ [Desulfovibrio sp.]|jgi:biopolymer transport protein TolQ|nr:protein TolQ [Desulfovibrio sp.]
MELDFFNMIFQATLVAKLVLLLLLVLSVSSWTLILYKYFSLSWARKKALAGLDRFTRARDLREAIQSLGGDDRSPLYHVAQQGVAEFNRLKEAGNSDHLVADNVRRSLRQGVSESLGQLSSSLSFLATTANTAPFIGLFGTVWGILYSFHQIGLQKTASLAAVAPGISEALVATAVGLFVAIPATVGYNLFLGMLSAIESELVNFAGVFLNRVQREIAGQPARRHEPGVFPADDPAYRS